MWIDTHCHLGSARFAAEEMSGVLARAREAGVTRVVTLATSLSDVDQHLAVAAQEGVSACIGIHPCDVANEPDDAVEQLRRWVSHPAVCAVGETGLDYYHPAPEGWSEVDYRVRQQVFLRQHFEFAAELGLNLVIHTRDRDGQDSLDHALEIYRAYHRSVRAVFHCFISGWEQAERVLELGGLVSFGGVATFKSAHAVRDTVLRCPAGSFMLETDAPYLAPEPHRGKRNEPAYMRHTAERIAAVRGESLEELARHTGEAAAHFFRFRSQTK